jgi:hypothetical protein
MVLLVVFEYIRKVEKELFLPPSEISGTGQEPVSFFPVFKMNYEYYSGVFVD